MNDAPQFAKMIAMSSLAMLRACMNGRLSLAEGARGGTSLPAGQSLRPAPLPSGERAGGHRVAQSYSGLLLCAAAVFAAGCRTDPVAPAQRFGTEANPLSRHGMEPDPSPRPSRVRLVVKFDVIRIEVPEGTVSDSRTLWNHLRDDAVAAERQALMVRNGLRLGVGTEGSWPPIKAFFDAIATTVGSPVVNTSSVTLANPYPLEIELSPKPLDQTVFYYRADQTLAGSSWPASRNILRVEHAIDIDDVSRLQLRVVPEIRQQKREMRWVRTPHGLHQVPMYYGLLLNELAVRLTLAKGEFLVIGPSGRIDRANLLGRLFLSRIVDAKRWESLYVVKPTVVRIGGELPGPGP